MFYLFPLNLLRAVLEAVKAMALEKGLTYNEHEMSVYTPAGKPAGVVSYHGSDYGAWITNGYVPDIDCLLSSRGSITLHDADISTLRAFMLKRSDVDISDRDMYFLHKGAISVRYGTDSVQISWYLKDHEVAKHALSVAILMEKEICKE